VTEIESTTEFQNLTTHCATAVEPDRPSDPPTPPTTGVCNLATPTPLAGKVAGGSVDEDIDDETYKIALDFPISLWGNTFSMVGVSSNGVSLSFFPAIQWGFLKATKLYRILPSVK